MRVLDRLDTPAQVVSDLGQTLVQNPLAVALVGDETAYVGHASSMVYRWFTDPAIRAFYPAEDHDRHARVFVSGLRAAMARGTDTPFAGQLVTALLERSPAFTGIWNDHEVNVRTSARKTMIHPAIGRITLDCQTLLSENLTQALLVYTATPGSEDADKLELLGVVGQQQFDTQPHAGRRTAAA